MKLKDIINEYGGSEYSKITSLQNYLTIDLDKFEKGLKESKHKAAYKKARKQFMKVVSELAWEHSKLHEGINTIKSTDALNENKFDEAVEGVEISIQGMNLNVIANVIVKALRTSYGTNANKIILKINKLMKIG